MRLMQPLTALALAAAFLAAPFTGLAAADKKAKVKPYTLKTCPVTDEKLGEMGKPYVFEHEWREIKLCCKSCLKDLMKHPAKYIKKIEEAEAKEAKSKK